MVEGCLGKWWPQGSGTFLRAFRCRPAWCCGAIFWLGVDQLPPGLLGSDSSRWVGSWRREDSPELTTASGQGTRKSPAGAVRACCYHRGTVGKPRRHIVVVVRYDVIVDACPHE